MFVSTAKPLVLSIFVAGFVFVSAAHATADPRKCGYGPARKADCARDAAKLTARHYLTGRLHLNFLWQGQMTCAQTDTKMLRFRCAFTDPALPGMSAATVTYRALSKGWTVRVALT